MKPTQITADLARGTAELRLPGTETAGDPADRMAAAAIRFGRRGGADGSESYRAYTKEELQATSLSLPISAETKRI